MFNFRRSMNPPRRSTTTPPTSERPSTPTQDTPPLPPGLSSHSHSYSGSQLRTPPSQKNDPYHHHLQQSQSKILGRKTGTKKYPPPIEHKAQSPKRPAPSTPGIIGRVSSLFTSPSSSGGGNLTVPNTNIPEDATTAAQNGRGDQRTPPSVKPKRKSLVNKFTKSSPKKSESISTTPTKTKRVPPPLAMTSASSASPSSSTQTSSFHPFRSITRSRSKLAQHLLGSFNEPEVDDTGDGDPSSLSSLHLSRSPRSARSPRSPRSPRTPRSPFFYSAESDAESDIRRPSGLGRRVSTSSLPPSPFGGSYPWEVRPNDQGAPKLPKSKTEGENGKATDEAARSEAQEQKSDEKGTLKERFRFPTNKSAVNLAAEGSPTDATTTNNINDGCQRKSGRPRAVSSPGLLLSIGRKVREKLERDRELGKLKPQLSNIQKTNETAKRETSPSNEETKPVQDIQDGRYAKKVQDTRNGQDTLNAQHTQGAPDMSAAQELQKTVVQAAQTGRTAVDNHAHTFSSSHELYRASVYSNDSEAGGSRERMMSFSLVHEFPEPPSTHLFTHPSRSSSESGRGTFIISPPPVPPLPASMFPLQPVPLEVPVKRSSSSTMDSSVSATTSTTTTATSLGVDGAGSICNAVRARIESCSLREIIVIPAIKALSSVSQTSNSTLLAHPEPGPVHLPNQILRLALSFLPGKKDIAPLACVSKAYAEVVRSLLYNTLELEALLGDEEDENTSTIRVQKLLATLVKRRHLTALTTKFICREWPEWFPPSPNDVSLAEEFKEDNEEDAQEAELQGTFLASTLVLVVSRMTGLKELVLPSYHPLFFSDLTPETRWTGLKTIEFTNITLGDEEARDMFAWLDNMSGLETLSFPRLVESGEVPTRTSNDSISSVRNSKRSSTCSKRMSVPVPPHAPKRSSIGTGTLYNPVLLNSISLGSEELPQPQQRSLLSLEKYAHSWTFLPNLKELHAPPTIVSLLATSRDEENSQGEERRPWRPLDKVTINIDMTLYTGLRPTALVQSLHGIKWLGLKFGERVDRRTVEKFFVAVGAALGSNGLERVDVEFASAWAAMTDESLYKIIDTVIPRYPDLRRLKMGYAKREVTADTDTAPFELSPAEETRLSQWMKHCPELVYVGLLSGSSWRQTTSLI